MTWERGRIAGWLTSVSPALLTVALTVAGLEAAAKEADATVAVADLELAPCLLHWGGRDVLDHPAHHRFLGVNRINVHDVGSPRVLVKVH